MTQLRSFVERIERLEEEISTLNADKSEVYKEAKSTGFDVKVLRKVIAARRMDRSERQEADALFDLYMAELEGSVRAHVEIIEEFDPETGEIGSHAETHNSHHVGRASGAQRRGAVAAPAPNTNSSPSSSRVTDTAGAVVAPPATAPAPNHDDDIPAFLRVQ